MADIEWAQRHVAAEKVANIKGRGAAENPSGRYEKLRLAELPPGWKDSRDGIDEDEADVNRGPATSWQWDSSHSVINRVDSPDIGFRLSINPYRGCEHGCSYCYARPTHSFLSLSPGLDFETRLFAKKDAAALLCAELARPSYRPAPIAIGFNTDAWQPLEKELGVTRSILEVLLQCRNPAAVISKSTLILRDRELLAQMAEHNLVHVSVSITTLDAELNARMEPRAASPTARLKVVRQLSALGIPVRVMVAPVIPGLTDHEMESILERAADAGAVGAGYVLLRLPHELAELFPAWLRRHYPARAGKVLAKLARARGGALYRSNFHERMRGSGEEADLLARRFSRTLKRLGLAARSETIPELDVSAFRRPGRDGQRSLF